MATPPKWCSSLSTSERFERAKHIVSQTIDQAREVIAVSEANRLIVYSPILASQIPRSYAANAFNTFQWMSLNYEIVRVCALWDRGATDRESIPAIADLVDDQQVQLAVAIALCQNESNGVPNSYVCKQIDMLRRAILLTRRIEKAPFRTALVDFRNERLAHSLTPGVAKSTANTALKYGYERKLLRASIAVINAFNGALRDSHFMFEMAFEHSQRHATALWSSCKFNVTE